MMQAKERSTLFSDATLFLLRLGAAAMLIAFHGYGKAVGAYANVIHGQDWGFIGFVGSLGFPFARFFAVCAALAEFVGAILLAAGLFTRYASAFVAFPMAVAVYYHAGKDMQIELAGLYLLISLTFIFAHPGRISLDAWLGGRMKTEAASEAVRTAA